MARNHTKAVAYLRVSSPDQVNRDGFDRQRDTISRYAKAKGIDIDQWYQDEGVSGTRELSDRPGLSELLVRLLGNGIRLVLVERADRLARDLIVSELILAEFRKHGIAVRDAESGTDLTAGSGDPTTTLIRQVLGAVSEFEKSGLVNKLRSARNRKRRETGRCEGRKPFGTRPGEAKTLETMRKLRRRRTRSKGRLRAWSYQRVADELNERGIPTRSGAPWQPSSVYGILQKPNSSSGG